MSSVTLNNLNMRRVENYAKQSGKTPCAVANQAIKYWYENHGEIVYEEMIRQQPARSRRKA
jgi:hypothetical protein